MRTLVSAAGEITDMEGNLPATMAQHGACAHAAMMLAMMLARVRRRSAGGIGLANQAAARGVPYCLHRRASAIQSRCVRRTRAVRMRREGKRPR